jgi:hypothetical protein
MSGTGLLHLGHEIFLFFNMSRGMASLLRHPGQNIMMAKFSAEL